MHVPDGFLDARTLISAAGLAAVGLGLALRAVRRHLPARRVPLIGLAAAFIFAAQMLNFPVAAGTSGHLIGAALAAVLLGPAAAIVAMTAVLLLQALMFADGGITALGVEEVLSGRHPFLRLVPERLVEVCTFLRDDPELLFDGLSIVTGVDWPAKAPADGPGSLEVVYHLVSYARRPEVADRKAALKNDGFLALKLRVPRDRPDVPSVMGVWAGADWHERETWDLLGVRFTGRSSLRRILLPEDWPGHPLRKDWDYPAEYHGVPIIPPEGR